MYTLRLSKYIVACLLTLLMLFSAGCTPSVPLPTEKTSYTMGSLVTQRLYGKNAESAANTAVFRLGKLEQEISWRIETSSIAKLNAAQGAPVPLSKEAFALLEQAADVAKKSHGAFHPAILPLSRLWQFDATTFVLPEAEEISSLLPLPTPDSIRLESSTHTAQLDPSAAIDLGGIGKGAACDTALQAYRDASLSSALVSVGGSIGVLGTKPDGTPWKIGLRDPEGDANSSLGTLSLTDLCVSTSGIYEKGQTVDGTYYHHLLDASTGYPVENDLLSVTVVHPSGALTDALATACMVLGQKAALPLLKDYQAEAVFIDKTHRITLTDGLREKFHLTANSYTLSS